MSNPGKNELQKLLFRVILIIVLATIIALVISGLTSDEAPGSWVSGLMGNLGTELLGALVTYLIFERFVRGRERLEDEEKERQENTHRWIRDLRSRSNDLAIRASNELKAQGYHIGDTLVGINLKDSKLDNICFPKAVLNEVTFRGASLVGADLTEAELRNTDFSGANLEGTTLSRACLNGAILDGANLRGAILNGADLTHASMRGAVLTDARLDDSILDQVIMPDSDIFGSVTYSPEIDIERYTKEPSRSVVGERNTLFHEPVEVV